MSKTFEAVKSAIVREKIQVSQHAVRELAADNLLQGKEALTWKPV